MPKRGWSRSGEFDRCRHCGRSDRPHEAKGFCINCYRYHRNVERERARRKVKRLAAGTVEKRYPKVRAWHVANADRVKAYKREWHKKNGPQPKWPVGLTVYVLYLGIWCKGVIVDRPNRTTVVVVTLGGTEVHTSAMRLRRDKPEDIVV